VGTAIDPEAALRAALVPAFTPRRWQRFVAAGAPPSMLRGVDPAGLARALGLGRGEAAALGRALARADPAAERAAALAAGVTIATWGAERYPDPLGDLADPPAALWLRGELLPCDRRAVAVVGSRRATPYGLRVARALAGDLARAGVTVVAGLARGIDAAAHDAALQAGGRTVAVLGSGFLNPYPPEHLGLLERVAGAGAVLSEFPLAAPPLRHHFPRRNRLVAALAAGLVVVEASARSGALSTVRHALDLGRAVMAVPGPVDHENGRGTLQMLREGAAPVGEAGDVFAALGWCAQPSRGLPAGERQALEALGEEGASAEQVAARTGLPEEAAAGYLVTLEVRGLVTREEGGRFLPR